MLQREPALQVEPPEPVLDRARDRSGPCVRESGPELVPIVDARGSAPADREQQIRVEAPGRGAAEGAFLQESGERELLRSGGAGDGVRGQDLSALGCFEDRLKEGYDRARAAVIGFCREIGDRIKRTGREIDLLLERGRSAIEGIGRALQRGREVFKELEVKKERARGRGRDRGRGIGFGF